MQRRPRLATLALLAALAAPLACAGFEADVHFGLTLWLARQAGFAPGEAEAIALANQRLDAGSIEYMASPLQFACLARFALDALDAQARHYPSEDKVPADAQGRPVVPGGAPALALVRTALLRAEGGKAAFMLGEFGRSLHSLQDSWAHRGVPSVPDWSRHGIECEPRLAMAAPLDRGTPSSHAANLTWRWPVDVEEMAQATYVQMLRYPKIHGSPRPASSWEQVRQALPGFSSARTKSTKSGWFVANGIADTSFLDGTSLPDGSAWKATRWKGRRDIPAPQPPTAQPGVAADLIGFYTGFLTDWVTTSPVEQRWLPALAAGPRRKPDAELVEQLMGWRLRDHGTYLAQEGQPRQAGRPSPLHRDRSAFEVFKSLNDAVLPTIAAGHKPSPILPFLVFPLPDADDGSPRAIALLKLIDAPYDTLGVIAGKQKGAGWKVTGLVSSADY